MIRGAYPVMVTPMDQQQEIDFAGLRSNVQFYLARGVRGLIALGSTGEFVSLSPAERRAVAETVLQEVAGRVPVLVGSAAETTRETIRLSREAEDLGASGLLIINPYYMKPREEEILAHYQAVAAAVRIPVMAYNNPFTSGVNMSVELLVRLAEIPNLTHFKESSGDVRKLRDVLLQTGDRLQGFCGSDDLALESFAVGAVGWVSVVGNFMPDLVTQLFDLAVEQGNPAAAQAIYARMLPLCALLETCGKLVQTTKRAMELIGQAGGPARSPRLPPSTDEEQRLRRLMTAAGLL